MRGSIIDFRQVNPLKKGYLSTLRTVVWGTTTDENENDILEIGKYGNLGYIDIADVVGIEITDLILLEYGFIKVSGMSNITSYYRDDFGYVKLDTYGIEHMYMKGRCIKYLHNFQRIFLDYTGKILYPKPSLPPKKEFKSAFIKHKEYNAEDMLNTISDLKKVSDVSLIAKDIDIDI